jgi:hypothetical protein
MEKLKEALKNINFSRPSLDEFFEIIEYKSKGSATFSKLRRIMEESYPNINKSKHLNY